MTDSNNRPVNRISTYLNATRTIARRAVDRRNPIVTPLEMVHSTAYLVHGKAGHWFTISIENAHSDGVVHHIDDWCSEVFGPRAAYRELDGTWFRNYDSYYFRNESERTMFMLKFS